MSCLALWKNKHYIRTQVPGPTVSLWHCMRSAVRNFDIPIPPNTLRFSFCSAGRASVYLGKSLGGSVRIQEHGHYAANGAELVARAGHPGRMGIGAGIFVSWLHVFSSRPEFTTSGLNIMCRTHKEASLPFSQRTVLNSCSLQHCSHISIDMSFLRLRRDFP